MRVVDELAGWWPTPWIDALGQLAPRGSESVAVFELREALATLAVFVLVAAQVRLARALLGGLGALLRARREGPRRAGPLALLRWLAGAAVVVLPAVRVWVTLDPSAVSPEVDLRAIAVAAALAWAALVAADHTRVWLAGVPPALHVQRGFAVFGVVVERFPLQEALIDRVTRRPILRFPSPRAEVRLSREAHRALGAAVGPQAGQRWLGEVLTRAGMRLVG
jgi:hypothetical protein